MTRPLRAKCDECKYIINIVYHEDKLPKGIHHTYFDCEHCGKRYTCFVTDDKVRMMIGQREGMKGTHRADDRLEMQEKINQRMETLKQDFMKIS